MEPAPEWIDPDWTDPESGTGYWFCEECMGFHTTPAHDAAARSYQLYANGQALKGDALEERLEQNQEARAVKQRKELANSDTYISAEMALLDVQLQKFWLSSEYIEMEIEARRTGPWVTEP
jgi:hypothetical protein